MPSAASPQGASSKALAICVGSVADISSYADTEGLPAGLLDALLPGPITVVLKRLSSAAVCEAVTANLDTLALRVPGADINTVWKRPSGEGHSFCRAVAAATGGALALTSANPSNGVSSIAPEEFRELWQHAAYVFDAGVLGTQRKGSTIIDLTRAASLGEFAVVREGTALESTLDVLARFELVLAPSSPGQPA